MSHASPSYLPPEGTLNRLWRWIGAHPALLPVILSVVMAILFALTVPNFADTRNILNIFGQLGFLGFLCIGMTFVMVGGGIDLSSYTVVSAAAVVGATVMVGTQSALLGAALMLLIGAGFGAVNGIAVAYLRMIPFIVTLSTMVLAEGFAIWFTQAQSVYGLPDAFIDTLSARVFNISLPWISRPFGIPAPGLLILAAALIMQNMQAERAHAVSVLMAGRNVDRAGGDGTSATE